MDLTKAAELQMQQNSQIIQIWAMFVTATFAAALLNVSTDTVRPEISTAITVGFLVFAYGHYTMLRDALKVSRALSNDMNRQMEASRDPPSAFHAALRAVATPSFKPGYSYAAHAIIDLCVVASIWAKHFPLPKG